MSWRCCEDPIVFHHDFELVVMFDVHVAHWNQLTHNVDMASNHGTICGIVDFPIAERLCKDFLQAIQFVTKSLAFIAIHYFVWECGRTSNSYCSDLM